MQPLAQRGYTSQEVLDALRGRYGPRKLSFRYDLLDDDNTYLRSLNNVLGCDISQNSLADIPRTARFTIREEGYINYLSDRIKPWVRLHMPKATDTYEDVVASIPDMVARYKADDAPSSTTAANSSAAGSAYDAAITGDICGNPALYVGGTAWRFDRDAGDHVSLPQEVSDELNNSDRLTVSFWYRPMADADFQFIIDSSTNGGISIFRNSAGQLQIYVDVYAGRMAVFTDIHGIGDPHHVIVTWKAGSPMQVFIDGKLARTQQLGGSLPLDTIGVLKHPDKLYVGRWAYMNAYNFSGDVDDVILWKTYVSEEDAARLYLSAVQRGKWAPKGSNYVEWPQGVFLLTSPSRTSDENGTIIREVEAYDASQVYADDLVTDRFTATAGDRYTDVVSGILGNVPKIVQRSDKTLPVDMEWEPGTSKLTIINNLLSAINYERLFFDEEGRAVVRPYTPPQDRAPSFTYRDDELSVTTPRVSQTLDLFGIANKWVLVVSDPDRPALRAEYVNDDPASITSTVARGRTIVDYRTEEDAADLETLEAKARALALEASQVFETIEFETAIIPVHGHADVIEFSFGNMAIDGKYAETEWSFRFEPGTTMRHSVRRVVILDGDES